MLRNGEAATEVADFVHLAVTVKKGILAPDQARRVPAQHLPTVVDVHRLSDSVAPISVILPSL